MPTTIESASLTVTVSEAINLNGQDINSNNQLTIPTVSEIDKRIVTIPTVEVVMLAFASQIAQGTFIPGNLKYFRITNKDDTNFVRLRLKKVVNGQINSIGTVTPGANYANGTYTNVPLTGGNGTGAQAAVTVLGTSIFSTELSGPGTGYVAGTYTNVPLTGGTGTGAHAKIVVNSGGQVIGCNITNSGTGYVVGDVLSASNTNLGGSGTGLQIIAIYIGGGVTSVVVTSVGQGYSINDALSATAASLMSSTISYGDLGIGGSGFSVPVLTLASKVDIVDLQLDPEGSIMGTNTSISTNTTNSSFVSFDNLDSINAQADTAPVDIEYFVASSVA